MYMEADNFAKNFGLTELSRLYVLKHKDMDVAMVRVNVLTGQIEFILDVYAPDELPVGC